MKNMKIYSVGGKQGRSYFMFELLYINIFYVALFIFDQTNI